MRNDIQQQLNEIAKFCGRPASEIMTHQPSSGYATRSRLMVLQPEGAWTGRLSPYTSSRNDFLLAGLVNANGTDLTKDQRIQAKNDLCVVALRAFCFGEVGKGNEIPVEVNGVRYTLDAVDLVHLICRVPGEELPQNFFRDNIQSVAHSIEPKPVIDPINYMSLAGCTGDLSQLKEEITAKIQGSFDEQKSHNAVKLISMLPPAYQGQLKSIPAGYVDKELFVRIIRTAGQDNQLPKPLQDFLNSCENNKALRMAIYTNPNIAARLLGFESNTDNKILSKTKFAEGLVESIFDDAQKVSTPYKKVSNWIKNEPSVSSELIFNQLRNKERVFYAQEMLTLPYVPSNLGVPCPKNTSIRVSKGNQNLQIHANRVTLAGDKIAIAAMQPIYSSQEDLANLASFFRMVAQEPNSFVFDLRSAKDLAGQGNFDYCPPVGDQLVIPDHVIGGGIKVTTLAVKKHPETQTQEVTLRLEVDGEIRQVTVMQFREWPDHGAVTPDQLRNIHHVFSIQEQLGKNPIVHCRAGVGRTGTLLTYAKLYEQLITNGGAHALIHSDGRVSKKELRKAVAIAVAEGRLERGPLFVQDISQFRLLVETLEKDIENADFQKVVAMQQHSGFTLKNKPDSSKQQITIRKDPLKEEQSSIDHLKANLPEARRVALSGQQHIVMSKEPIGLKERTDCWKAIFSEGKSIVEIVSDPNKLAFSEEPSEKGVNFIQKQIAQKFLENGNLAFSLGDFKVLSVQAVNNPKHQHSNLTYTQAFTIQYQTKLENGQLSAPKTIEYKQVYTPFDGKKLNSSQLTELVENLYSTQDMPSWMVSAKGVGRPSAIWMAQAIRSEIAKGNIKNQIQLQQKMDQWIKDGRRDRGRLFVHSKEQYVQLLEFGQQQLKFVTNKATTDDKQAETGGIHNFIKLVDQIREKFSEFFDRVLEAQVEITVSKL